MTDYWTSCCLITFTGIGTGLHAPAKTPEAAANAVTPYLPSAMIQIIEAPFTEQNSDLEWPRRVGAAAENFILTSYLSAFGEGYRKVVGLFSLPPQLTKNHLEEAWLSIRPLDVCLGSDTAGGIYLLGMNRPEESLIKDKPWGEVTLSKAIIREAGNLKKILYKLPVLGT